MEGFGVQRQHLTHGTSWLAIGLVVALAIVPLWLAVNRLSMVTGLHPAEAMLMFPSQPGAMEALRFSFLEASISTLLTVAVGAPLAWALGRYEWRRHRGLRSLFSLPFVTPPVVAAAGFLALISSGGWLYNVGIDLRTETGVVGKLSEATGWAHPGHMVALVLAHAWFNISLMIRFVEPIVAQLSPNWDEQLRMLPQGRSRWHRVRHLWWPLLGPAVTVAAAYTFFFAFTSFAMVKWLAPSAHTLESLMASLGGSAGIPGYRVGTSVTVLSIALIQGALMLLMFSLAGRYEQRHVAVMAMNAEHDARRQRGPPPFRVKLAIGVAVLMTLLPYVSILLGSVQRRSTDVGGGLQEKWTLEGWKRLLDGDISTSTLAEAAGMSLAYAVVTLVVALPLGYAVTWKLVDLRQRGHARVASALDLMCMVPLSMSAVMIGLGMVVGLLTWSPGLFQWTLLPVVPHVLLLLPFIIRLLTPALARINPAYTEQADLLGIGGWRRWWLGKGAHLMPTFTVAASLALAFSLGEFGATYLMVRVGSWDSLSILVDQLLGRPKFDPIVMPTAFAAATSLMGLTLMVLWLNEGLRRNRGEAP